MAAQTWSLSMKRTHGASCRAWGKFLPYALSAAGPCARFSAASNLPQGGRQVLGADLNCSESRRGGPPFHEASGLNKPRALVESSPDVWSKGPEVCEAKEVESLRLPLSTFRALLGRMPTEADQSGLGRVQEATLSDTARHAAMVPVKRDPAFSSQSASIARIAPVGDLAPARRRNMLRKDSSRLPPPPQPVQLRENGGTSWCVRS
jgi:hypothetical protein